MTWCAPQGVASVRDDDGIAWVLSTQLGRIVRLDLVSSLIWEAADGASSTDDLVARLVTENGWDPEEIRAHVEGFVDELTTCGLLEKEAS